MSRWLPIAVALLVGLLVVQKADGAGEHHASCTVAGSSTLFENARARVFTRTYGADRDKRTQVCRKSDGHHFGLAQDVRDVSRERVHLAGMTGDWLRYSVLQSDKGTISGRACRFDVPAAKRRCVPGLAVHGVGVTRAGTLAWLADSGVDSGGNPFCCSVYRLDAGAQDAVALDQGADIEADSFAVAGHRAYWTKAGEPRSAALP